MSQWINILLHRTLCLNFSTIQNSLEKTDECIAVRAMKVKWYCSEGQDLALLIVCHHTSLLCVMARSLLDVVWTRTHLIGIGTQIHLAPLYYSAAFFLYHQVHKDNFKRNWREKKCSQLNTISIFYLFFFPKWSS